MRDGSEPVSHVWSGDYEPVLCGSGPRTANEERTDPEQDSVVHERGDEDSALVGMVRRSVRELSVSILEPASAGVRLGLSDELSAGVLSSIELGVLPISNEVDNGGSVSSVSGEGVWSEEGGPQPGPSSRARIGSAGPTVAVRPGTKLAETGTAGMPVGTITGDFADLNSIGGSAFLFGASSLSTVLSSIGWSWSGRSSLDAAISSLGPFRGGNVSVEDSKVSPICGPRKPEPEQTDPDAKIASPTEEPDATDGTG